MRTVLILSLLFLILPIHISEATNWCNDANVVLCLPADDASGTDVSDESSNNSTCTYNGAWGNSSMPKGYMVSYLDFDGSNDYVDCGDAAGTDFIADTTDFSVA